MGFVMEQGWFLDQAWWSAVQLTQGKILQSQRCLFTMRSHLTQEQLFSSRRSLATHICPSARKFLDLTALSFAGYPGPSSTISS
jgi:hypothetical protein